MRDHYLPFTVGKRWFVTPPEINAADDNRIRLIMERGAFGSGEHETSRSCLELLETFPPSESLKILDLGSGTGILTIAALLLNPGHAWCVDIEAAAVQSCQRNCRLNAVEERVTHLCGTLDELAENGFDLILANIYGDILLDVAEELVSKAAVGARILLSGILWEYNFEIRKTYQRHGCRLIRNRMLEEFSTVLLEKG